MKEKKPNWIEEPHTLGTLEVNQKTDWPVVVSIVGLILAIVVLGIASYVFFVPPPTPPKAPGGLVITSPDRVG